jgi:hypothetical protein
MGGGVLAGGALLSLGGEPRLTLLNAALQFDHPWQRGAAALAAAGGAALLAALVSRLWGRLLCAVAAAAALWASLDLFRYRVVSGREGLAVRDAFGEAALSWSEVTRVEHQPTRLLVRSAATVIEVRTGDFRPEDRAALERNIARHLTPTAP